MNNENVRKPLELALDSFFFLFVCLFVFFFLFCSFVFRFFFHDLVNLPPLELTDPHLSIVVVSCRLKRIFVCCLCHSKI